LLFKQEASGPKQQPCYTGRKFLVQGTPLLFKQEASGPKQQPCYTGKKFLAQNNTFVIQERNFLPGQEASCSGQQLCYTAKKLLARITLLLYSQEISCPEQHLCYPGKKGEIRNKRGNKGENKWTGKKMKVVLVLNFEHLCFGFVWNHAISNFVLRICFPKRTFQ
jgi:hypothetical protein